MEAASPDRPRAGRFRSGVARDRVGRSGSSAGDGPMPFRARFSAAVHSFGARSALPDAGDWRISDAGRGGGVGSRPAHARRACLAELGSAPAASPAHLDCPTRAGSIRGGHRGGGDVPAARSADEGQAVWNAIFALTVAWVFRRAQPAPGGVGVYRARAQLEYRRVFGERHPGRLLGLAIQGNCHPGCLGPVRRLVNSPGLCRVAGAEGGDADNGGILPLAGLLFFALPDSLRRRPSIIELLCLGLLPKTTPNGGWERARPPTAPPREQAP